MILPVLKAFLGAGESLREATVVVASDYERSAFEDVDEVQGQQATERAD